MATFKSILSIVRVLTTGKEAGAMKEAFLAAAVCVLIFGAIAGIQRFSQNSSEAGLIAAVDASVTPLAVFVKGVLSSFG